MKKLTKNEALKYINDIGKCAINLEGYLYANPSITEIFTNHNNDGLLIIDGRYGVLHSKNKLFLKEAYDFAPSSLESLGCVEKSCADYLVDHTDFRYEEFCHICTFSGKQAPIIPPPTNLTIKPIDPIYIDYINDFYTYKGPNSRQRLLEEITMRPSSALYDGNKLLAWNLIHKDMAMGVMFVPPIYRGKGYAQIVAADLMQKIINLGHTPFVQIVDGNIASLSLAAKLGFREIFEACWLHRLQTEID